MTDQKQIPSPPMVTAVVVRSGVFEAQIGSDKGIVIQKVGPQNGRSSEATQFLDLVAHGRDVLGQMQAK